MKEYGLVKGLLQFDEYPEIKNQESIFVEFGSTFDHT